MIVAVKGGQAMTHPTRTIQVEPGSELDHALDEEAATPVELERSGVRYRVTRVDGIRRPSRVKLADDADIWAGYDPERVRAGLRKSVGVLRGVDLDQLRADLAEQREQDSAGRPA
jgi:hypothetical protein